MPKCETKIRKQNGKQQNSYDGALKQKQQQHLQQQQKNTPIPMAIIRK